MTRLEGMEAIEYAEQHDLLLNKYNDPTEEARQGLTVEEARAVALEDARLIWIEVEEQSLPVLRNLEAIYGNNVAFDYVSDIWGNNSDQMTPEEVIHMHKYQGWNDDGYRILRGAQPGEPVLVDSTGIPILKMPQEVK